MDANGQRFWLLADAGHWRWRAHTQWDPGCRALALASERELPAPADPAAASAIANGALERIPRAVDELDGVARWHGGEQAVVVRSPLPGEAVRLRLPEAPTDLAVGVEGVLYAALPDGVRMHDLRGRWGDVTVSAGGFVPWRIAADPAGGLWVLERVSGRLARLTGMPLALGGFREYSGTTFRPNPENCDPPTLDVLPDPAWPAGERAQALAFHPDRGLAVLSWAGNAAPAQVRLLHMRRGAPRLGNPYPLRGARFAYALAFLDATRIAVRVPGRSDAPAFELPESPAEVPPTGEIHPLASEAIEAPFAHRLHGPPRYPVTVDTGLRGAEPLHPLSLSNLARHGEARHFDDAGAQLLDSGDHATVWHRLYAEAKLPACTGFVAWAAATDDPQPPAIDDREAWLPHRFGDTPSDEPQAPRAAFETLHSELPHHPGLAAWPHEPQRAGLWSVLLQNPRRRVRRLTGRYLWLRVELFGDGRTGPEIVALRAWASRFSYRDRYLPRLYHEDHHGAAAHAPGVAVATLGIEHAAALDAGGGPGGALLAELHADGVGAGEGSRISVIEPERHWQLHDGARAWRLQRSDVGEDTGTIAVYRPQATPADFLERLLGNFEGVLTTLEDRVAHAHLLSDPDAAAEPQLDWLAAWVGVAFDPALPEPRRRAWLRAAPRLARLHGTRAGLELALDVASGGGVSGGEIVVIEDFRLRRLLATLLGVDLDDQHDPLLPGLIVSGNSVVGDTLMLGEDVDRNGDVPDELRAELLALFREEIATAAENDAVRAFHARLAHRATVLVHEQVAPADFGLLRRIVELESPAHAQVRVEAATWPLLVGVASLVGVDTYLGPCPPRRPARVQVSSLGQGDFVTGPAALDPRLAGAATPPPSEPPVADAGEDFSAPFGESFELDGGRSRAAEGRRIDSYTWRRLPPI